MIYAVLERLDDTHHWFLGVVDSPQEGLLMLKRQTSLDDLFVDKDKIYMRGRKLREVGRLICCEINKPAKL